MSTKQASKKNMYLVEFFDELPDKDDFDQGDSWLAVEENPEKALAYAREQDGNDREFALVVQVEMIGVFARNGWRKASP
jgi:hypothetical protein